MAPASTTDFDLARIRDLHGRGRHVWLRRGALTVITAFVVAALVGVFGQTTHVRAANGPAATLSVQAPSTVRGGLLWHARVTVRAQRKIAAPTLVLGSGFIRGMQLNSSEPAATSETSRPPGPDSDAPFALSYGTLEPGDVLTVYLQLQVDPTTVGEQDVSISLEGAKVRPVRLPARLTVLP